MLKSVIYSFAATLILLYSGCAFDGANVVGPAGGFVFYDKGDYNGSWRYLEAAPEDAGEAAWGTAGSLTGWSYIGVDVAGTGTAIGDGFHNTELILAKLQELGETGKAAQLCEQYRHGGYNDWYLPSKDEVKQMYNSFKSSFDDSYSVYYWSSSQYSQNSAYTRSSGAKLGKEQSNKVRPIRRF